MMELFKSLNEAKLHSRIHFEGLDISIEVPAGGYRRGTNKKTGEEWAHKIKDGYGYIKGTHSPDGEHLDCYLRKNPKKNAQVYVVHQLTVDGSRFDEDKVMLGYSSESEAVRAFKSFTFKPSVMYGGVTEFSMEHFQVVAFSASKSHAMLTNNKTFDQFKKKGLLGNNIKSPIMVARKVSESLQESLAEIGNAIYKGDLSECLDWSGYYEGAELETVVSRAYGHYSNTPYMFESNLSEQDFRDLLVNYIMEREALEEDTEDQIPSLNEEILDDYDHESNPVMDIAHTSLNTVKEQEEEPAMEANNFAVVVHTQIMENIGTKEQPSWATAGTKVQLVQEGFANYGEARALAAKVAAGEHTVEIVEGAYVLGIDVMPTGEFRQFYEEVEAEEAVEEDTTDDVFFAQQIQETQKLAGVQQGSYVNKGTPTVHETRARLEELSQGIYEALESEEEDEEVSEGLDAAQLSYATRLLEATIKHNPHATSLAAAKAVCNKLYGNTDHTQTILQAWEQR